MTALWNWLKDEANRKILAFFGAGVLAVAAYFGWGSPKKEDPLKSNPAAQNAQASGGGLAVNASGTSQVGIGVSAGLPAASVSAAPVSVPSQSASASSSGTAVNAAGNAQVFVKP